MERNIFVRWATAKVIWEARNQLDIPRDRFADFANFSESFIAGVERGTCGISLDALLQLAEILKVEGPELVRRIVEELKRGPQKPQRPTGRQPKTKKQEKTVKAGAAGVAAKKKANKTAPTGKPKQIGKTTKKRAS